MSPEFWAIIGVGGLIWFAVSDGINRITKRLDQLNTALESIQDANAKAPWAYEPEPHIGDEAIQ